MAPTKRLDLNIEVDVLTAGAAAKVVNCIFETLLYQRNQIPFVYKTYRYYVNKWLEEEEKQLEGCCLQSFQAQRKKEQATATKETISSMRQTIRNILQNKSIKSLRFLFGSTIFTAKECYTIHIPTENISANHFYEQHQISPGKLNHALLSLLTNEDLYAIFSQNLNTTNVYLELELLVNENSELVFCQDTLQNSVIFPKDLLPLPVSCKDIHIYLMHKQAPNSNQKLPKCCKELQVFEDFISLNIKCNEIPHEGLNEKNDKSLTKLPSEWWEAETVVRGFKDHPTKGFNIWS